MASVTVKVTDEFGNSGEAVVELVPQDKPLGPEGNFELIFSDDFDTLDETKWVVQENRNMNGVYSRASNVVVEESLLKLNLSVENGVVYGAMVSTNVDWDPDPDMYMMARGDVVEALIYFPGTPDEDILNWGGFWTSGTNWPQSGENDIAEGGPDLTINYHGIQSVSGGNTNQYVSNGSPTPTAPWRNKWIRATLHRTLDNKSRIYFDGVLMREINTANHELADATQAAIFSLGKSDGTVSTSTPLLVDWFKAYRQV